MAGCTGIKLIAVDMDGTFLNDNKTYNRERFLKQYEAMNARGIRFVVASGNQYYKLKSYFKDVEGDIAYVAENGGYVHNGHAPLFVADIPEETLARVYRFLVSLDGVSAIICGKNSAYALNTVSSEEVENARHHYERLEIIQSYQDIDDTVLKIALKIPPSLHESVLQSAQTLLSDVLTPVTSGHEWIDLILPGVHKAYGISLLQQQWNIADDEVAAFGDSGNDIEMLKKAGFSFAMGNANEKIKQVARYKTLTNNEEGVLEVIDRILQQTADHIPCDRIPCDRIPCDHKSFHDFPETVVS